MKILMAGGGSGGHVTPLRPIITSLKKDQPQPITFEIVVDRGFYKQAQFLFSDIPDVELKKIFSGKYRRYNSKSALWHMTHLPTILKNLRDIFYIVFGTVQSIWYFTFHRPDVVFCKGGFVCIPVGITAKLFGVPLVIHDSDTHPGLTNRILARWAAKIATGMPEKYYTYPKSITSYTGIPVSGDYTKLNSAARLEYKKQLGFDSDMPLVVFTGGGTGAATINEVAVKALPALLQAGWQVSLITGKNKSEGAQEAKADLNVEQAQRFQYHEFTEMLPQVLAADVIVSRAGATALQEFANAAKTVIIIPSPYLTGGHQLKNAAMFEEQNACMVIQENDLTVDSLVERIIALQKDTVISKNLYEKFAKPASAQALANLIREVVGE